MESKEIESKLDKIIEELIIIRYRLEALESKNKVLDFTPYVSIKDNPYTIKGSDITTTKSIPVKDSDGNITGYTDIKVAKTFKDQEYDAFFGENGIFNKDISNDK